ncbi:DsbA family protein [Candidatus Giovannonibacteria bacterium]|nr:DsbA family protein [Candidatus Giovannonibacteria bacterium]
MDENNSESQKNDGSKFLMPSAVIVAGLVIAAALIYVFLPAKQAVAPESASGDILEIRPTDHVLGNPAAKITLFEYGDFQCPYCGKLFNDTLPQIREDYIRTGKVNMVYRHFPLNNIHSEAQKAAESAECAGEQGKFWEYHDNLYQKQTELGIDNFKMWAVSLGLDAAKFNSCLDSGKYAGLVNKDLAEGISLGIDGTPASFVNSRPVPGGAVPFSSFKKIIDEELNK